MYFFPASHCGPINDFAVVLFGSNLKPQNCFVEIQIKCDLYYEIQIKFDLNGEIKMKFDLRGEITQGHKNKNYVVEI